MSIFAGFEDIVNRHLFSDEKHKYRHKRSCLALSAHVPDHVDGVKLVAKLHQSIRSHLRGQPYTLSKKNWELRQFNQSESLPSSESKRLEEIIERAIAQEWQRNWFYQTPVASGLLGKHIDKRCAIDLVFQKGDRSYDFVELKVGSDTPLFAAFEILRYGLAYLVMRRDANRLLRCRDESLPVMEAREITLVVLAPEKYYDGIHLAWLEIELKKGLQALVAAQKIQGLAMDFRFEFFPDCLAERFDSSQLVAQFSRMPVYEP